MLNAKVTRRDGQRETYLLAGQLVAPNSLFGIRRIIAPHTQAPRVLGQAQSANPISKHPIINQSYQMQMDNRGQVQRKYSRRPGVWMTYALSSSIQGCDVPPGKL